MLGTLSFHVLGPLEVLRSYGARIDLGGRQPRLVLGRLLVAEGRVVAADSLLDTLWGQHPPDSAGGTLQTYVSRLRRALGPNGSELLRYGSSGYLLDVDTAQVDARQFERLADEGSRQLTAGESGAAVSTLRQALSLWRGEVLGGEDADFVRSAAARWQERRLAATEDLFDAELRIGRASAVIADLSDGVGDSPLRERLRGLLALALYRAGRQADALSVLDRGRRLLDDELGLELSRELRELQNQILCQVTSLDLPTAAPVQVGPNSQAGQTVSSMPDPGEAIRPARSPRSPGGALVAANPEMIGRAAERRTLSLVLAEALGGGGCRHVIIEGEPGIGKTRLAQDLVAQAEAAGAISLSAATLESGQQQFRVRQGGASAGRRLGHTQGCEQNMRPGLLWRQFRRALCPLVSRSLLAEARCGRLGCTVRSSTTSRADDAP